MPDVKKTASWYSKLLTVLSKKIYFIYPEYLDDCITDVSNNAAKTLCLYCMWAYCTYCQLFLGAPQKTHACRVFPD